MNRHPIVHLLLTTLLLPTCSCESGGSPTDAGVMADGSAMVDGNSSADDGAMPADGAARDGGGEPVALTNDMVITASIVAAPGTYDFADTEEDGALIVGADDIVIDLNGAVLAGGGSGRGYGVRVNGHSGVTIRNCVIGGYRAAIFVEDGGDHVIEDCDLSGNHERPASHTAADFLGVWHEYPEMVAADQIGNGVVLLNSHGNTIRRNTVQRQQNGVGLFGSDRNVITDNDVSGVEGWGFHLTGSSDNRFERNVANDIYDHVSTYCRDVQADGCDAAAVLIIKGSDRNVFVDNEIKNSGDGIFLAGFDGITRWGADDNEFTRNDATGSKHHAFEATFADGNTFTDNIADQAGRVGFWLGGSTDSVVTGNTITRNAWAGIWNQGARGMEIAGNTIADNTGQGGIYLEPLSGDFLPSADYTVTGNTITGNRAAGIWIADSLDGGEFTMNDIRDNERAVRFAQAAAELSDITFARNHLGCAGICSLSVENLQRADLDMAQNYWGSTDAATIARHIYDLEDFSGSWPPNAIPRLEVAYRIGSAGPFHLQRAIAHPQDDGGSTAAGDFGGTASSAIDLGSGAGVAPGGGALVAGFRFEEILIPPGATIVSATLSMVPAAISAAGLALRIAGDAGDDSPAYSPASMPVDRTTTAANTAWAVAGGWTTGVRVESPDLSAIIAEIIARPGWTSGNALSLLVANDGSAGHRRVNAYDADPITTYSHRFSRVALRFDVGDMAFAVEEQIRSSTDDTGDSTDGACGSNPSDDNIHLGRGDMCAGAPELVAGLRFVDVRIPRNATITAAHLVVATDGTYTNALTLRIRGDDANRSGTFGVGDMPTDRTPTTAGVPWNVTETWGWMDWHTSPDFAAVVQELAGRAAWSEASELTVLISNDGSSGHRRIFGFDRDPVLPGGVGRVTFEPFLSSWP